MDKLLGLRKAMKTRKPDFLRQDAHKVKRLPQKWRRPKGLHSKMRHKFKGYRALVSKGYKSPSSVRGLSGKGLQMVTISSLAELMQLNAETQAAVIARSVGMRKKLLLVDKANERGISIINIDQNGYRKVVEEKLKQRKSAKVKPAPEVKKAEGKNAKDVGAASAEEKFAGDRADKKSTEAERQDASQDESKKQQDKKQLDKVLTRQEK
ncbi:50S ribosomal protein L32e [Candidatus Woesearchaeota archaeon]|nr:50S ribosomal protein L32e [Candidatus Woesearchaeota archaeon]